MKIDLHVHSKCSTRPSQWILQKLGCPESFTPPLLVHQLARERGMDLVTIADHNTIDGALQIAHLPDAFVSLEITSYFPEDGCKVHVLALNITEAQFRDIQKVRENVYELVPFLRSSAIPHVCAHPLYGVNGRLTVDHVEKLLLLFKNLELNGSRCTEANQILRRIVESLTPEMMDHLADKHGIEPGYPEPWLKTLTGGSDDHGGLNIARKHTVVPGATNLQEFLLGLAEGRAYPAGEDARPETMAHNLSSIAYQFYKGKFHLERVVGKDVCINFVDRFLSPEPTAESGVLDRIKTFLGARRYRGTRAETLTGLRDIVQHEAARMILDDPALLGVSRGEGLPGRDQGLEWTRFVDGVANQVLKIFADRFFEVVSGGNFLDIFHVLGSAGALYTMLAPHFVSYAIFGEDRHFAQTAAERLLPGQRGVRAPGGRIAHCTDTYFELNGVAKCLRDSVARAERLGLDMRVLTCGPEERDCGPSVVNFAPIGVYSLPEYPQQPICYPPILEVIRTVHEQGFTHLHAETPGPMGLAALLAAKVLHLPVHASYHTQIPQYVRQLTGDDSLEDISWRFMRWFYNSMDKIFAPSQATAQELIDHGIDAAKVAVYPRGVDTEVFHPRKRNGFLHRYGFEDGVTLLYVGRLSREKNLDLLAEAWLRLAGEREELNLLVVGDGPQADALKDKLTHPRCRFAGVLGGEELAACYASSDLFVFPSLTDTFGNVVLEAQASGLPIIVSGQGGPPENVVHGVTGLVLEPMTVDNLARGILDLARDADRRADMGRAAREHMEGRHFDEALRQTWDLYLA
jgi:glycosyltransferase involved in cell wall biosynthesis